MVGDSKTADESWNDNLINSLRADTGLIWEYDNTGVSGASVESTLTNITTVLAASENAPIAILANLGANDMTALPSEATWTANYLDILDQLHAKWPDALVYVAYPWRVGKDADAATLHGWIDSMIAARAWLRAGHDEAVWLKGADDGATMTSDGVHYSTAGQTEATAQWLSVLGYR